LFLAERVKKYITRTLQVGANIIISTIEVKSTVGGFYVVLFATLSGSLF